MKTPLMELIEKLNKRKELGYRLNLIDSDESMIQINLAIHDATELLEKEREVIEKAVNSVNIVSRRYYNSGGFGDDDLGKEITSPDINNDGNDYFGLSITGSDYYTKTFTNESK